jgi:hypothetical protein
MSFDPHAIGWGDAPPGDLSDDQRTEAEKGLLLQPPSGFRLVQGRQPRRARRVYHAALAGYLKEYGAQTGAQLRGQFGWFFLQFTESEVEQLVQSARLYGVVEAIPSSSPDEPAWWPTDRGNALPFPRGASLEDLALAVLAALQTSDTIRDVIQNWWGILASLAAVLGAQLILTERIAGWLIAAVALAALCFVLASGLRGELALRAAAEQWPRLKIYRPAWHAFETRRCSRRLTPLGIFLVAGLVSASIVEGWTWGWLIPIGAAVVTVAYDQVAMRSLRTRRRREIERVLAAREEPIGHRWWSHWHLSAMRLSLKQTPDPPTEISG